MPEKKGGRRTVRRWVVTGLNPEGTEMHGWRNFDAGEPPTEAELPSKDGTAADTQDEGAQASSTFPGTPRKVPRVQRGVDLDK